MAVTRESRLPLYHPTPSPLQHILCSFFLPIYMNPYTFLHPSCHDHFQLALMQSPNSTLPPSTLTRLSAILHTRAKNSLYEVSDHMTPLLERLSGFLWHAVKVPASYPWPWRPWVIWPKPAFLFFFGGGGCYFRATSEAYGGFQARGGVGSTAASLCHSHSNVGSEPCQWPTPQLTATLEP